MFGVRTYIVYNVHILQNIKYKQQNLQLCLMFALL